MLMRSKCLLCPLVQYESPRFVELLLLAIHTYLRPAKEFLAFYSRCGRVKSLGIEHFFSVDLKSIE